MSGFAPFLSGQDEEGTFMLNIDVRAELNASLFSLLKKMPITDISIHMITSECGLSRRTFYNHFSDKYDLMAFLYYCSSENCWFHRGHVCTFKVAYTRHLSNEHLPADVFNNMFHYVGQNDIRGFMLKKVGHDLRRMFYYNHMDSMLKERDLRDSIQMLTYGIVAMYESRIRDASGYVPEAATVINCIPEKYREALLRDPLENGPRQDIVPFDPASCQWPPMLYLD